MDTAKVIGQIIYGMVSKPDGFTIDVHTATFVEDIGGYVVGGHTEGIAVNWYWTTSDWGDVIEWVESLPTTVDYIGLWFENGRFYVDACDIVLSREEAFDLAFHRGELAVYNGYEGITEYVSDYQEASA